MNYKIKVESEAESKEAQELFFELGCTWSGDSKDIFDFDMPEYIVNWNNGYITVGDDFDKSRQEITLPQLRDLVVLKRNDVGDATHTDGHYSFYVGKDKNYFFSSCDKAWRDTWKNVDILKPIEKPMKEYLNKLTDGTYKLVVLSDVIDGHDGLIEIPEGAQSHHINKRNDVSFFLKCENRVFYFSYGKIWAVWVDFNKDSLSLFTTTWQREPIDKNEQALKEILEGEPNQKTVDAMKEADGIIQSNIEQSGVDKTLSERQSQYGCFEDVAHVTQGMIHLMRQCGYDDMPQPHQMALTMIASKMARIVNGDCNHLDSWHDIGGYSKLIENLIEGK